VVLIRFDIAKNRSFSANFNNRNNTKIDQLLTATKSTNALADTYPIMYMFGKESEEECRDRSSAMSLHGSASATFHVTRCILNHELQTYDVS